MGEKLQETLARLFFFFFKQGAEVEMHETPREKTQERGDKGCLWGRDLAGGVRSGKETCFSHLPF